MAAHICPSLVLMHVCTPQTQARDSRVAPPVLDCPLLIELPCETHTTVLLSFPSSPTSLPIIPLPPPPLCTSLLTSPSPHTPPPHTENDQPSLVWFDRGKFYLTFEGKLCLHRLACVHTHTLLKLICASSPLLSCPALSFPFSPHRPLHRPTHT